MDLSETAHFAHSAFEVFYDSNGIFDLTCAAHQNSEMRGTNPSQTAV
jgi:plastocyanin